MRFYASLLAFGLVASASTSKSTSRIHRIPDSEWDNIIHGSDILRQRSVDQAKSDGYLSEYSMRSKITDPSSLKIDTVKQLSGYLDDNTNDKHLFFCRLPSLVSIACHGKLAAN